MKINNTDFDSEYDATSVSADTANVFAAESEQDSACDQWGQMGLIQPATGQMDEAFWQRFKELPKIEADSDWIISEMVETY